MEASVDCATPTPSPCYANSFTYLRAEACGRCLLKMLCADENGSIWVIEESECYEVKLPDRHTLRGCDDD